MAQEISIGCKVENSWSGTLVGGSLLAHQHLAPPSAPPGPARVLPSECRGQGAGGMVVGGVLSSGDSVGGAHNEGPTGWEGRRRLLALPSPDD